MHSIGLILIVLAGFALMVTGHKGAALLVALELSLWVFPVHLYGVPTDPGHTGIAASNPIAALSLGLMLVAVLLFTRRASLALLWLFVPLIIYSITLNLFHWNAGPAGWSGILLFSTAALAWPLGAELAFRSAASEVVRTAIAFALAFLGAAEVFVCTMQIAHVQLTFRGRALFPTGTDTAEFTNNRVHGTFDHPDTMGKVLFLLLVIALPLTRAGARRARMIGFLASASFVYCIAASQARANFIAVIALLVIWAIIIRRRQATVRRGVVLAGAAIAVAVSYGAIAARFASDPNGGSRSHFLSLAYSIIPHHLITGFGPNSYVHVVGAIDIQTAEGFPVHNALLLTVAEIGIVGAALLFGPCLYTVWLCLRRFRIMPIEDVARSYLAAVPGLAVIAWTGWGLMQGTTFIAWCIVQGYVIGSLRPDSITLAERANAVRETANAGRARLRDTP